MSNTYAVDDEFGTQITTGLESYDAAKQVARRCLSAHRDACAARIYEDSPDGEIWDVTLTDVS
jgi:spore coat protein U-like protein